MNHQHSSKQDHVTELKLQKCHLGSESSGSQSDFVLLLSDWALPSKSLKSTKLYKLQAMTQYVNAQCKPFELAEKMSLDLHY